MYSILLGGQGRRACPLGDDDVRAQGLKGFIKRPFAHQARMGSASKTARRAGVGDGRQRLGDRGHHRLDPLDHGARVAQGPSGNGRRIPARPWPPPPAGRRRRCVATLRVYGRSLPAGVAAPHDPVDADPVALGALDRRRKWSPRNIGGPRSPGRKASANRRWSARSGRSPSSVARTGPPPRRANRASPGRRRLLGEDHGEVRMVRRAAEDQVPQRPVRPPVRRTPTPPTRTQPSIGWLHLLLWWLTTRPASARRPQRPPSVRERRWPSRGRRRRARRRAAPAWRSVRPRRRPRRGLRGATLTHPARLLWATRRRSSPASDCARAARPSAAARAPGRSAAGAARLRPRKERGTASAASPGDAFDVQFRVAPVAVPVALGLRLRRRGHRA